MNIYYAKTYGLTEEEVHFALWLLPKERRDKLEKMKQNKSRMQSLSAGLLLEYALREQGLSGKVLTFLKYADGKPYFKEFPDFCYNLSHSGSYAALAADKVPVGVDIEGLRRGHQKLAARFFAEEEVLSFHTPWSDEEFTRIWTRKESYIKATGYGMRMPLDAFSTIGEQVKVNEKMCREMADGKDTYYLASFRVEQDYWLSVCRRNAPILGEDTSAIPKEVDLKGFLKRERDLCMMN